MIMQIKYQPLIIAVIAAIALIDISVSKASPNGSLTLPTIPIPFPNQKMVARVTPTLSNNNDYIKLDITADVDVSDLQAEFHNLNGRREYKECGTRFSLSNARLSPVGNGKLLFSIKANAEQWVCTNIKLPKFYTKRSKISLPFGGWTYGLPKVYTKWETKTGKTRLVSQSTWVEGLIWPTVQKSKVRIRMKFTKAAADGLLGGLVNGILKSYLQLVSNLILLNNERALPKKFDQYKIQVKHVDFVDHGGGRLALRIEADGKATMTQLSSQFPQFRQVQGILSWLAP
jgi:hypothetical protein